MIAQCTFKQLQEYFEDILKEDEDSSYYINITNNRSFDESSDIADELTYKLQLETSFDYNTIYIIDDKEEHEEFINSIEIPGEFCIDMDLFVNSVELISSSEEIGRYINNSYCGEPYMYLSYTPYIDDGYEVYLKEARISEDGCKVII